MTYQPRFHLQFKSEAVGFGQDLADQTLTPLEEELSLLDCAIPMTRIPELADLDGDHDLGGTNLFSPTLDTDALAEANILRTPRRSRQARGRIVALRRRAVRQHVKRPLPQWPLPGGQAADELRKMRDCIYAAEATDANEQPSVPLRVATHALSLSLIVTALPVGAAVMTYNRLKGEDMRVTARLTGLALAVIAGNPGLAQMIGA